MIAIKNKIQKKKNNKQTKQQNDKCYKHYTLQYLLVIFKFSSWGIHSFIQCYSRCFQMIPQNQDVRETSDRETCTPTRSTPTAPVSWMRRPWPSTQMSPGPRKGGSCLTWATGRAPLGGQWRRSAPAPTSTPTRSAQTYTRATTGDLCTICRP